MSIIISHLWYDTTHDFEMEQARVFRCGRITVVEECTDVTGMPLLSFAHPAEDLYCRVDALSFVVEITAQGRDFFFIKNTIHPCDLWRRMGGTISMDFTMWARRSSSRITLSTMGMQCKQSSLWHSEM